MTIWPVAGGNVVAEDRCTSREGCGVACGRQKASCLLDLLLHSGDNLRIAGADQVVSGTAD